MTAAVQSVYNDTVDLLKGLSDQQLSAVQAFIADLSAKNKKWKSPLGIETEEQLWKHIDHSLAQINPEDCKDADVMCDELLAELGL